MNDSTAWKAVLAWFTFSIAVLFLEGALSIVTYVLSFGVGYGGLVYFFRHRLRKMSANLDRARFPVFIAVAVLVSILEEFYVYLLGNSIAVPNIWLDIIVVPAEWAAWFSAWYFLISRHFSFSEKQVLLCAGLAGILFEYSGKGFLLSDPLAMAVFYPTAIVVYAAIFILPMQFMKLSGTNDSWIKYPVAVLIPYFFSIPVGVLLYFTVL